MRQTFKIFASIFLILTITTTSWFYSRSQIHPSTNYLRNLATSLVTKTRLSLLDSTCSGFQRASLQSSSDTTRSSYIESVSSSVGIDGIAVVRLYINKEEQSATSKVQENQGGYAAFVIPFIIGLVILVIAGFVFLTCCICPKHCPPKGCCRKRQQQTFQQSELFYPFVALIIVLIAVLILVIYGFIVTSSDRNSYQRASCSTSILFDDTLNGNTSTKGYYFVGLNSLAKVLNQLKTNMSNIDSNFSMLYSNDSTATINQALTQTQTAMNNTIKISNNDMAGSNLVLNYGTPLDSATPTGSINSLFPTLLGSYSSKTGYVYTLYLALNTLYQVIFAVKNNATTIHNTLSSIEDQLLVAINNATRATKQANDDITAATPYVKTVSSGGSSFEVLIIVYLVLLLVGCIVCGIAAFLDYKRKGSRCRYALYILSVILFVLAVFGFLVAIFLSFVLPVYSWTCKFSDQTLSNSYYFQYNLKNVYETQTLKQMETCMPFSNGDLIPQIGGLQLATNFDILRGIFSTLNTFNSSFYMTPINIAMSTSVTIIGSYALTQIIDITDFSALSVLSGLTNCNTLSYLSCNTNCKTDSWVPSNTGLVFPCLSFSSNRGNAATCSSGVASTSGGCSGCMDTTQALHRYVSLATGSTTLLTDLAIRYGAVCSFNTKLSNVWNNYYKVKAIALGPTINGVASSSGVYPRTVTVNNDVTTLTTTIGVGITTVFANVNSNLDSISDLIDPTYGLLSSLNCQVIGQDITRTVNVGCGSSFTYTYHVRIVTGVISYFLLIALFFVVCIISKDLRMPSESLVSPDTHAIKDIGSGSVQHQMEMQEKQPHIPGFHPQQPVFNREQFIEIQNSQAIGGEK